MQHYSWDSVPLEVLSSTISRKIITGDRLMIAQVFIKNGGVVPRHEHENEQVTYILEGALQFELEGQTVIVAKGQVLHIPSNVPHEAVALEDTIDLDIFNPPRQDWITGQDAYLRS
jgi:quercetin dioxygenase-like cupin family protein